MELVATTAALELLQLLLLEIVEDCTAPDAELLVEFAVIAVAAATAAFVDGGGGDLPLPALLRLLAYGLLAPPPAPAPLPPPTPEGLLGLPPDEGFGPLAFR